MNLHEDNEVFSELIAVTAAAKKLPEIYVEKDYWVTRALKYLSTSAHFDQVVFKGGTSLSKAYRLIDRFSEDIDLAIFESDLSDNQRKRLLKNIENDVTQGLTYIKGHEKESKGSKFRKTIHQYPRSVEGENFGQASPELFVEINAFTRPDPIESRTLQTLIAEELVRNGLSEPITQYELQGFNINVLSVKRTLIEKLLSVIKDSYKDDPTAALSDRIRHLYDICLILSNSEYRDFVRSDQFKLLCTLCIADEKKCVFLYDKCLKIPLAEAPLFSDFSNWRTSLNATYTGIFSGLVYGDLPDMSQIEETLSFLQGQLK